MKVIHCAPTIAKIKLADRRVSVCSNCQKGIFIGQEYYWSRGKICGLVHTTCEGP